MAYITDFDLDDIVGTLTAASHKHPEGSKERDAIELAQIALLYTRHLRKDDDFARYYREFFDPAFKVRFSHEFSTRAEADAWLASGKAQEAEFVKIAGQGYRVARATGRLTFIDAPLPAELAARAPSADPE
jgi:hypothetical protein